MNEKVDLDELCRQGKLYCHKCGTVTKMYRKPFCPKCDEIKETPTVNLSEVLHRLENKTGTSYRDYWDAILCLFEGRISNDSAIGFYLDDKRYYDDCNWSHYDLVKQIDEMYSFDKYLFYVSW